MVLYTVVDRRPFARAYAFYVPPAGAVDVADSSEPVLWRVALVPLIGRRRSFVDHHRYVIVDEIGSPKRGVATEERDVPASLHERVDVLSHARAPILI